MTDLALYYEELSLLDNWRQRQISRVHAESNSAPAAFQRLDVAYAQKKNAVLDRCKIEESFERDKEVLEEAFWVLQESIPLNPLCEEMEMQFVALQDRYRLKSGDQLIPDSPLMENTDYYRNLIKIFRSLIDRNSSTFKGTLEHLFKNPKEIPKYVENVRRRLIKKKDESYSPKLDEGVWDVVTYPVGMVMRMFRWFWQRMYLPMLRHGVGWIGDQIWAWHVQKDHAGVPPETVVLRAGTDQEMTKEDFDAIFNGLATVVLISTIISVTVYIPFIGEILWTMWDYAVETLVQLLKAGGALWG